MSSAKTQHPQISWDMGTGYDFFVSLLVLHHPAKFGLRGAWAAGVRSRLAQEEREFLEGLYEVMPLDGRHASTNPIFGVSIQRTTSPDGVITLTEVPGSGSFHIESKEPVIQYLNAENLCAIQ